MAKSILGIDFGQSELKLVLTSNGKIIKNGVYDTPDNLVQNGRVMSMESAGELLKEAMKESGIRCNKGAIALGGDEILGISVTMPAMTHEQLLFNLPYEFKDFISGEINSYVYDYAVISVSEDKTTMDLMAVAAPRNMLEDYRSILRKAGLKLVKAAPVMGCMAGMIVDRKLNSSRDFCLVELAYQNTHMWMFNEKSVVGDRMLDNGLKEIEAALAEAMLIDAHLAHTYIKTNYNNCHEHEALLPIYDSIASQLMRAINFHSFSNPDSQIGEVWICGGGTYIKPLVNELENQLELKLRFAGEAFPELDSDLEHGLFFPAASVAIQ